MNASTEAAANKLLGIYDLLRGKGHVVPNNIGCDEAELIYWSRIIPTNCLKI